MFFSFVENYWASKLILLNFKQLANARAQHKEPATTSYSCHGVFTDRSSFTLNLSRIQIPTGTSVTNCNHKHGLLLTCRHVHVRPHCFVLTEACSWRLGLAYFTGKISKHRLVYINAVALPYYASCRLPVMGSWPLWMTPFQKDNVKKWCCYIIFH